MSSYADKAIEYFKSKALNGVLMCRRCGWRAEVMVAPDHPDIKSTDLHCDGCGKFTAQFYIVK